MTRTKTNVLLGAAAIVIIAVAVFALTRPVQGYDDHSNQESIQEHAANENVDITFEDLTPDLRLAPRPERSVRPERPERPVRPEPAPGTPKWTVEYLAADVGLVYRDGTLSGVLVGDTTMGEGPTHGPNYMQCVQGGLLACRDAGGLCRVEYWIVINPDGSTSSVCTTICCDWIAPREDDDPEQE